MLFLSILSHKIQLVSRINKIHIHVLLKYVYKVYTNKYRQVFVFLYLLEIKHSTNTVFTCLLIYSSIIN